MFRNIALAFMMIIACPSASFAQDSAPIYQSDQQSIFVPGSGTLDLRLSTDKKGAIAEFTPITPLKSCSGSCDGNSVGSWTCPDNMSCELTCSRPPVKGCTRL